jgi:hypothetical protein
MRRAAFVLWAAAALSRAAYGQTILSPGVAVQGHIESQARAAFGFYASPNEAVLIRALTLSQDNSLQFTVTWTLGYPAIAAPQVVPRHVYSVPNPTAGLPPIQTFGPAVSGSTFSGEYDLPGGSLGFYTITVFSQNQVAGDFLLVYASLEGNCPSSNPSCGVAPLNCGVPALNRQTGSPQPAGSQQPVSKSTVTSFKPIPATF